MPILEKNSAQGVYHIPVNFTLYPNKQRLLIEILEQYSSLELKEMAELLSVPLQQLKQVLQGKTYFNEKEVIRLVEYFCICCGA